MNKCLNCNNNCCSRKFVGLKDSFKHVSSDKFCQILLSENEVERIKRCGGEKYIEKKDGIYRIALNPDNSCKASNNGICDIYDARPDVCKLYPFFFDPFAGLVVDKNCSKYTIEDLENCSVEEKQEIFELLQSRLDFFKELNKK